MESSQEIKPKDFSGNSDDEVHHLLIEQVDSKNTELQVVRPAEDAPAVHPGRALPEASATTIYLAGKNIEQENRPDTEDATAVGIENSSHSNFPVQLEQCLGFQTLPSSSYLPVLHPPSGTVHLKTEAVAGAPPGAPSSEHMANEMVVDEEQAGEEDDASELSEGEDVRVSPQNPSQKPST
jgi:hypothetical protein